MEKIAKDFFEKGYSAVHDVDAFFTSDLFVYLKSLYRKEPIISSTGFIKVIKKDQQLYLYQHLYYDLEPEVQADFYISLEELNIESTEIQNTELGYSLFKDGFATLEVDSSFFGNCIKHYPGLKYVSGPENDSLGEPKATFKLRSEIWSKSFLPTVGKNDVELYNKMHGYFKSIISFSNILKSLDLFDVNFLEWTKGRSMDAHNGVDYRSFVNFISYNTENTKRSRELECGSFDWYDITFSSVLQDEFSPLMQINNYNVMIKKIRAQSSTLILVNSFNPRFYHQVLELDEEDSTLYTSTANMTFSNIAKDISFQW